MKTYTYVHDARPSYPFRVTAVRWTPDDIIVDGLTLVLAHANGLHKVRVEVWFSLSASSLGIGHRRLGSLWSLIY